APMDLAFNLLSLDIETGKRGQLYSIDLHQQDHLGMGAEKKVVLMIGDPEVSTDETPIEWMIDEKSAMIRLGELFKQCDPDILTGWHVVGFDLKFLEKKSVQHQVTLNWGRDGDRLQLYERSGANFA